MGTDFLLAAATAIWLGLMTSISPCPLATNIAAMSYVSRKVDAPEKVFFNGILYVFGRTLTYAVIAILLIGSMLSQPELPHFLQKYMHMAMGPVLIVVGMIMLELITFRFALHKEKSASRCSGGSTQWRLWGRCCSVSFLLFPFAPFLPLCSSGVLFRWQFTKSQGRFCRPYMELQRGCRSRFSH